MSDRTDGRGFFGWRVVAGAFLLAIFGWGVGFYGPPIFLEAVLRRTGWPLPLVSAAVTFHFLVGAAVVANLPAIHRRLGLPRVTAFGAIALSLGVLGWAEATAPWQLFLAAGCSGMGWVAMGAAAVNAIIAPWFIRKRPAALTMAYNGASIGGIVFSPLWVTLIRQMGFAAAALLVGVVAVIAIALLCRFVFRYRPEDLGQQPDGDGAGGPVATANSKTIAPLPGRRLWQDRRFITLAAGMALGLFAQIGLIAHLFSLLVPALGAQAAGLAMGGATLAAIAGRTAVARTMPASADRRLFAAASYAIQILGSILFMLAGGANLPLILAGILLFGLGIGNATSLPPLIAQNEFAREDFQRAVSQIVAISQASYAFAPAVFGAVRTLTAPAASGAPEPAFAFFAVAALIQAAGLACFLAGRSKVEVAEGRLERLGGPPHPTLSPSGGEGFK